MPNASPSTKGSGTRRPHPRAALRSHRYLHCSARRSHSPACCCPNELITSWCAEALPVRLSHALLGRLAHVPMPRTMSKLWQRGIRNLGRRSRPAASAQDRQHFSQRWTACRQMPLDLLIMPSDRHSRPLAKRSKVSQGASACRDLGSFITATRQITSRMHSVTSASGVDVSV